jgi:hypothetical protein
VLLHVSGRAEARPAWRAIRSLSHALSIVPCQAARGLGQEAAHDRHLATVADADQLSLHRALR